MQHHTVQQLEHGPRAGKYVYTGGNHRIGRYVQGCSEAFLEVMQLPEPKRDHAAAWARIGHDTAKQAYAHMRERLLENLRLDTHFGDWSGCRAPLGGGIVCDVPTKLGANIPPCHFLKPLCDKHRTRAQVEAMWEGPCVWSGSW